MFKKQHKTTTEQIVDRAAKGLCALRFLMNKYGATEVTMDMTGRHERITVKIEDTEEKK